MPLKALIKNKSGTMTDLLRIFLPLECPVCGGEPFDGSPNMLCAQCFQELQFLRPPFCPLCGGELHGFLDVCESCLVNGKRPWKGAVSAFRMDGLIKELLHRCKYQKQADIGVVVGKLCLMAIADRMPQVDCIVPVPLHWTRYLTRGFNQTEIYAKVLSEGTGIPLCHALRRQKYTKQQAKLDRNERNSNLSGAFSVFDSTILKKRAILLVDDVMTTGATLSAAARTIKKAGAAEVYVFTVARRQRN